MSTPIRPFTLRDFLLESNRIEGIAGVKPTLVTAAEAFLARPSLSIGDFIDFVKVAQPDAVLRDKERLNVRVGSHIAPRGGSAIADGLEAIVLCANERRMSVYDLHVDYEMLHPFTDGNGRSGRILWLWMMGGVEHAPLGFLHHWYYQSLQAGRRS